MEYAVLGGLVGALWALLLWLSIIVWVYRDVRSRTRDLALQVLAVFMVLMFFPGFNIPGLILYLMLRPHDTLEEAYVRSLEEEALLKELGEESACPSCRRFVEADFLVCPYCRTQLKERCGRCERLLSFTWVACPYCGAPRDSGARPEEGASALQAVGPGEEGRLEARGAPPGSPGVQQVDTSEVAPYKH